MFGKFPAKVVTGATQREQCFAQNFEIQRNKTHDPLTIK